MATFLCPSDANPLVADWPGGNSYLGNMQTWACDLGDNNPSTVSPADQPQGIFYYQSSVKLASITDGTSNTAFFSEKIRGTGMRDPDARSDSMITTSPTSLDATYLTCLATNPLTATRLTHVQGASWVMGEMCCTEYNHVSTPNKGTCAGLGFANNSMANMPMQVPPSSQHPGGVNTSLRRRQREVHQEQRFAPDLAGPGHPERRRGHFRGCILMRCLPMLKPRFTTRFAVLSCSALFLLGGGCGSGSGGAVLPSDEVARTALESALKAWQGGGKPGTLAGTEPPVEVRDTPWAKVRNSSHSRSSSASRAARRRSSPSASLSRSR